DNHTVGSGFRSFGKTWSCSADQLRVEPLLRWRGNRPVVRHRRRGAAFCRCPGSGNRRNEHHAKRSRRDQAHPHPPRADADGGEVATIHVGGQTPSPARSPHGRTRMPVFPERRSVELKMPTASSRVETLPMFVRSLPSRTRRTISLSWARSDTTTKSTAKPSA